MEVGDRVYLDHGLDRKLDPDPPYGTIVGVHTVTYWVQWDNGNKLPVSENILRHAEQHPDIKWGDK